MILKNDLGDTILVIDCSNHTWWQSPYFKQPYDAIVALFDPYPWSEIALHLVRTPVDWVNAYGDGSEQFHDLVDAMSVDIGRQGAIGEGNPMTVWNADVRDILPTLSYGGHGHKAVKVLLLVGESKTAKQEFVDLLKRMFS
jgi:hypothetical protein